MGQTSISAHTGAGQRHRAAGRAVAERRAAEYVRDELQRIGLPNVRLEPFRGAVSSWLPLAVAFSLAAWAMLLGLLLGAVGGVLAALLYALATWTVFRELYPTLNDHPVRRWLWRGDSQNVVGVIAPSGPVERRVALISYLDSARCPFWWRNSRRRRRAGCLALPTFLSLPVCVASFLLSAVSGDTIFYWIAFVCLFPQIAALFISLHAEHSPVGPGANHNAAGVGTLLALARRLAATPLAHTEVWLAATGCRETGGDGVRALLHTHGSTLSDATFIALEGVGAGERVVYLTAEGFLAQTPYHPSACALGQRVAIGQDINPGQHRGGATEMGILTRSGFKGITINVWPRDEGVALGRRRADDTVENIDRQALAQAHSFAWALLQDIDGNPEKEVR